MGNLIIMPERKDENADVVTMPARTFDFTFYAGILSAVILPQSIFCFYFPFVIPILGAVALSGGGLGWAAYRKRPYTKLSVVPDVSALSADIQTRLRRAA
jgi:hypothetical protein